jgi:hypothetical protein
MQITVALFAILRTELVGVIIPLNIYAIPANQNPLSRIACSFTIRDMFVLNYSDH